MKKKLTRQIGYRPEKKEPVTAKEVISWLKAHPLFKWGVMCKEIGIDKSNFSRTIAHPEPVIAPAIILKIVAVISDYGFAQKK